MLPLIAKFLKNLRVNSEITQKQWVEKIGTSSQYDVSRIERGKTSPSDEYLQSVAEAYSLNLESLIQMRDNPEEFEHQILERAADKVRQQVTKMQDEESGEAISSSEPLSDDEFKVQEIAHNTIFAPYGATIELVSNGLITQSITIDRKSTVTVYIHPAD